MRKPKAKPNAVRLTSAEKVVCIREILFPGGDLDHEWDVGYLDDIARVILDYDPKTGYSSWPPEATRRSAKQPRLAMTSPKRRRGSRRNPRQG
jgi:hypothetical protein